MNCGFTAAGSGTSCNPLARVEGSMVSKPILITCQLLACNADVLISSCAGASV